MNVSADYSEVAPRGVSLAQWVNANIMATVPLDAECFLPFGLGSRLLRFGCKPAWLMSVMEVRSCTPIHLQLPASWHCAVSLSFEAETQIAFLRRHSFGEAVPVCSSVSMADKYCRGILVRVEAAKTTSVPERHPANIRRHPVINSATATKPSTRRSPKSIHCRPLPTPYFAGPSSELDDWPSAMRSAFMGRSDLN